MYKKIKKAFSLTEVLVATFIGAIILWFIAIFLWDVLDNLSQSKKEIKILTTYFDFLDKLVNYRDIYNSGSIFIANVTSSWSDVFLMENATWDEWILFWVIDLDTYKLDLDNSKYKNTWIGFRFLTSSDLISIKSDKNLIYGILFQKDNVFRNLNIKDLQITSYNSGTVFDIDFLVNIDYQSWLQWELWENLPKDNILKFNLSF